MEAGGKGGVDGIEEEDDDQALLGDKAGAGEADNHEALIESEAMARCAIEGGFDIETGLNKLRKGQMIVCRVGENPWRIAQVMSVRDVDQSLIEIKWYLGRETVLATANAGEHLRTWAVVSRTSRRAAQQ